jgi:hypothetical protein
MGNPTGGRRLTGPAAGSLPHLVDLTEFFVTPRSPGKVIGWVESHAPRRSWPVAAGVDSVSFGMPASGAGIRLLVLEVRAVQDGSNRSAVRVDAIPATAPTAADGKGPGALRVVEGSDELGEFGYELRCQPAGGTLPDPARICRAIRHDPSLLYSYPGPPHSCPAGTGFVSLIGTWQHKPLKSSFSECSSGLERQDIRWLALLPNLSEVHNVRVDHGIGPITLGEPEAEVIDFLRGSRSAPPPCPSCTRTFPAGGIVQYGPPDPFEQLAWKVSFENSRLVEIWSDIELFLEGMPINTSFSNLRDHLYGWTTATCGQTQELIHSSATATTAIVYQTAYRYVTVTSRPPQCPAT